MSWKLAKKLKDTHLSFGRSSNLATQPPIEAPPPVVVPVPTSSTNSQPTPSADTSIKSSRPPSSIEASDPPAQPAASSSSSDAPETAPVPQICPGTLILTIHEGKALSPSAPAVVSSSSNPPVNPLSNGSARPGSSQAAPSSAPSGPNTPSFDQFRPSSRDLPYALVDFDNHQIFVNAVSGDSTHAMWAGSSTQYKFDVSRAGSLNITLYYRNPAARPTDARRDDLLVGKCSISPSFTPTNGGIDGSDLNLEWHELSEGHGRIRVGLKFVHNKQHSLTIEDFELLKVVGKGSFGKVMQVKKRDTQRIYALKTIRKAHIISRSEVSHTLAERSVLAQINNPFIVPLKFSFQSPEKLYLVLAFVNGGELFHHLQREQRFDINRARFYAAELLCALECLHGFNVIYRDLKPENILLDYTGHIALCDFGLCKLGMKDEDRTNTFCGTPEYLAPELLTGGGYTKAVDWWTLGVLLYEMLVGLPPFYDENTDEMYRKILTESVHFPGPEVVPPAARDLLTRLLDKNAENRLGFKGGAAEIKMHYFFTGIDWRKLLERKYEPSFKPNVSSQLDTSNFDREFTSEAPMDSYVEGPTLSQTVQQQFAGWSYNRPVAGLSDVGGSVRDPSMDQVTG